jgi:hydrogenase nickel incorporation protein HypA/HybF
MHELSLLLETIKVVERECPERGFGGAVRSLTLTVGELNSAVPSYLEAAWPEAVRGTILDGSALIIEKSPAIALCKKCGTEFEFKKTRGICSRCGSGEVTLKSGREFFVKELVIE